MIVPTSHRFSITKSSLCLPGMSEFLHTVTDSKLKEIGENNERIQGG